MCFAVGRQRTTSKVVYRWHDFPRSDYDIGGTALLYYTTKQDKSLKNKKTIAIYMALLLLSLWQKQKHFKNMQILCLDHTYPPSMTKLAIFMWSGICICQRVSKGQPDKREKGVRRQVSPSTAIPKNRKNFLRVDDNKTELFKFLHLLRKMFCARHVRQNLPISQKEADTRLILHATDAVA